MRLPFVSLGQGIGASATVLPYSGLISFRIELVDLAIQGTHKSLQHHNSKALILSKNWWTTWTFVDKVMSLLYNMLSRFVVALLPRSKCFCLFVCLFVF